MTSQVGNIIKGFLAYLEKTEQSHLLPRIVENLAGYLTEKSGTAEVITAEPMTDNLKRTAEKYVARAFGSNHKIVNRIDPSIIGGIVIRVGDKVLDQSVRGKIRQISEATEKVLR